MPIIQGNFGSEILDPLKLIEIKKLRCQKVGSSSVAYDARVNGFQ